MLSDAERRRYLAKAREAARRGEAADLTPEEEADLFQRAGFQALGARAFIGELAGRAVKLH